jgi:hypothetical protein
LAFEDTESSDPQNPAEKNARQHFVDRPLIEQPMTEKLSAGTERPDDNPDEHFFVSQELEDDRPHANVFQGPGHAPGRTARPLVYDKVAKIQRTAERDRTLPGYSLSFGGQGRREERRARNSRCSNG